MTFDVPTPPAPAKPRARWDLIRRITAVGLGLAEAVSVIGILLVVGAALSTAGPGAGGLEAGGAFAVVAALAAPGLVAGLISGTRFFTLYSGYARQGLDPTAGLSPENAASGARATNGMMGDGLWGALIGGIAGAIPAALALSVLLYNPFFVLMAPIIAFTAGIGWYAGWAAGAVFSALLGTALGLASGSRGQTVERRLPFLTIAVFLPLLLVAVVVPTLGVRFDDGDVDAWSAILFVAGLPLPGAEFVFGDVVLVITRIVVWLSALLFAALIVIGTPALLRRTGRV